MVQGVCRVKGELWDVNSLVFTDRLEGYPDFYGREILDINTVKGTVEAWAYILKRDNVLFRDEAPTEIGIEKKQALQHLSYNEPIKYWIGEK